DILTPSWSIQIPTCSKRFPVLCTTPRSLPLLGFLWGGWGELLGCGEAMEAVKPAAEARSLLLPGGLRIPKWAFAAALLAVDAILVSFIIAYVPYTKIDWDAYMSQVDGFIEGERDYMKLQGDTGPLVYPAGFLYIYTALKFVTGGRVHPAQVFFGILYILNLAIVMFIYLKTEVLPWWAFCLLCLSKRIHSIFMLRLFNDCFAMTLLHAALASILCEKWHLALIIFSAAVSVKMNVLLFAPPLFLLMLKAMNMRGVFSALFGAALLQVLLGLPFLLSHPVSYISQAFNLGRVFIHFWCTFFPAINYLLESVNFKFVPEDIFISKKFASLLLLVHLGLLAVFSHKRWCKHEGGLICFLHSRLPCVKVYNPVPGSISNSQFLPHDSSSKILNKDRGYHRPSNSFFLSPFKLSSSYESKHWIYDFQILQQSCLLVFLQFAFPSVDCAFSNFSTASFVCSRGAMLEYLSFKFLFLSSPVLYSPANIVGTLDCPM
ncbi:hypothetical protein Taro_023006, partial [Colocasia esculenta]|nr:hypothetical protein [Colocasia esculenta]